jgi:Tfp pilus assembly protein PilN
VVKFATMNLSSARLGFVMLGDRLAVAAIHRNRVETFTVDAENPAAALRAELDARGLRTRTVAIGLARSVVIVKQIELPAIAGKTDEMVRFELERHLPTTTDDPAFDYIPLPVDAEPDPNTMGGQRVLICAADRRLIDTALRVADEAKLRPVSITVAAHDLLSLVHLDRSERVAWLHRTGDMVDLLLLQGASLVFSRTFHAFDDATLLAETRRSLAGGRWRGCDAVWVSGDNAAAGSLVEVGAPVTEPPWTARAQQRRAAATSLGGAHELALATAMGRGVRPLDLIPSAIKPRRLTHREWRTAGALAATILLTLAALLLPGYMESRRLTRLNREIARIDPEVRAAERIVRDLDRKRQLLATVEKIGSSAIRPLPLLRELTDIIPADAWLTYVAFDAKGVELTGQAGAASTLIPLLENSPRLERVEFASPVTRGRDREQFRIRASWESPGTETVSSAAPPPPAALAPPPPAVMSPTTPSARPAGSRAGSPDPSDELPPGGGLPGRAPR